MTQRDFPKSERETVPDCPDDRPGRYSRTTVRRFRIPTVVLLVALGGGALFLLDPARMRYFPRCLLHELTGLQCPGCGTARALHAALHGRFAAAFRFNPALPVFLAMIVLGLAFPRLAQRPGVAWGVLAFVLAWGVVRNLVGM